MSASGSPAGRSETSSVVSPTRIVAALGRGAASVTRRPPAKVPLVDSRSGEPHADLVEVEREVAARDEAVGQAEITRGALPDEDARRSRAIELEARSDVGPLDDRDDAADVGDVLLPDAVAQQRGDVFGPFRHRRQDTTVFRLRNARRRAGAVARRALRRATRPASQRMTATATNGSRRSPWRRPWLIAPRNCQGRCRRRRTSSASSCRRRGHNCGSARS